MSDSVTYKYSVSDIKANDELNMHSQKIGVDQNGKYERRDADETVERFMM